MVVQLPRPDPESGVIEDARRRQRRHRLLAAALTAAAAAAALILGFLGGGGGAGADPRGHGHGSSPTAGAHVSAQAVSTVTHIPPDVNRFGLLAPGVGWAADGTGFYITRDGGRRWEALSLDTDHGKHYGNVAVPGFGLSGDIGPSITASASPTPRTLILAFDDGHAAERCHTTPAVGGGAVASSFDGGRTWRTRMMPGCVLAGPLSFVSATTGFALAGPGRSLYETTNGASKWRQVGRVPAGAAIDFTTARDGWALGTNGKGLYHTTDGGHSWRRASICAGGSHAAVSCGVPFFFGSNGVVNAYAIDAATHTVQPLVYTTGDGGGSWSRHAVPVRASVGHAGLPVFSAPDANDLFVLYGGMLETSTDAGRSWTRAPEAVLGPSGQQMEFVNANYGWVRATQGRLYYTTDGGRGWRPIGTR